MKKVSGFILSLCLALLLVSCSSLPKAVAQGTNVVTGRSVMECRGFFAVYGSYEGVHTKGLTITFKNTATGEEIPVKCNDKGYYSTSKLVSGEEYKIYEMKYTTGSNSGTSWIYQRFDEEFKFVVRDASVMNLGELKLILTKDKGYRWILGEHQKVEQEYISNLLLKSEWSEAPLIRRNPNNTYEECVNR